MTAAQLATGWRKSSYSAQETNCVEIGLVAGGTAVRDTKDRAGGHIAVPEAQWQAFVHALKHGRFTG